MSLTKVYELLAHRRDTRHLLSSTDAPVMPAACSKAVHFRQVLGTWQGGLTNVNIGQHC